MSTEIGKENLQDSNKEHSMEKIKWKDVKRKCEKWKHEKKSKNWVWTSVKTINEICNGRKRNKEK